VSAEPDLRQVPIRPAATVMLLRDGEGGPEVFMLRRAADASFAGGAYVFPGGRVDDADRVDDLIRWCTGLDDAAASRQLGIDRGGLAYWVAAVRECFEEAGVLLARHPDGSPYQPVADERRAVHAGELSLAAMCARDDVRLDLGGIEYVAHWVTPVGERRRFDTRFFAARAPTDQEPVHDDAELVASEWIRPAQALARFARHEALMLPPTLACLRFVADHADCDAAMVAAAAITDPPCILPRLRPMRSDGSWDVALPGDPDYDTLPESPERFSR
jgi:8-oxo-dGTP pyrophosphatase MutT (NUDIX family)